MHVRTYTVYICMYYERVLIEMSVHFAAILFKFPHSGKMYLISSSSFSWAGLIVFVNTLYPGRLYRYHPSTHFLLTNA